MLQILKMEEEQMKETKTATVYAGLGAAIAAELMIGFRFGTKETRQNYEIDRHRNVDISCI